MQHPPAQLVPSQTQWLPLHRWPAPHAALVPQVQVPFEAQVSALLVSQVVQPPPALPQEARLWARQALPLQHPLGQLVPSHTQVFPWHRWPVPHGAWVPHWQAPLTQPSLEVASHEAHAAPPAPQVPADSLAKGTQVAPLQQPVGQLVGVHTQVPP
jgi:hypothetical protein